MFDLYDYQADMARRMIEHMNQGGAPCGESPTGSGKTVILAEITRYYRSYGYKVILAAHRKSIIKQIAASCQKHCQEPVGFYAAKCMTEDMGIMVTMMPTLARRRNAISTFRNRVFLLDEGHHLAAKSYQEIIREIQPSFFGITTATPVTPTGAGLGKFGITKLLLGLKPAQLIEEGKLCNYELYSGDALVDTEGVPTSNGDFNAKKLEERIVEVNGDFVRDLLRFNPDLKPTISVTVSKAHAYKLAEQYNEAGITARVILGDSSDGERDKAFKELSDGRLKVVVSVALIDEGLDIPEAVCLQLIRPTKSLRLWKQLIGRVLRADKNNPNKIAIIIDHGACWKSLPLPDDPINWTLEGKVKFQVKSLSKNESGLIILKPEKPANPLSPKLAQGNSTELRKITGKRGKAKEAAMRLTPEEQKATARLNCCRRNLYLVEVKDFPAAILKPWANNPNGLSSSERRRVERALGLPLYYCERNVKS
jgi:DNA repair protein RadD